MLAGVGLAAWQRYVLKPARFRGSSGQDALIIYCLVVAVVGANASTLAASGSI